MKCASPFCPFEAKSTDNVVHVRVHNEVEVHKNRHVGYKPLGMEFSCMNSVLFEPSGKSPNSMLKSQEKTNNSLLLTTFMAGK